jgi:2-keto-3-deoxy-L-rhamnonate aldolase RhmA
MAIAVNAAKARLKRNQLRRHRRALVRNVDIIKVMKAAGFDWLFLDLEHGVMGIENAAEICVAAQDSGIAPIVRVPYGELAMATRLLDGGALGIVIPHVDTAEEAKEIADRLRYPPLGHRSVGGGQAQFDYAPMKMATYQAANDNMLLTVMIETPKAVRNAEAIAAVPGIDCLLSARATFRSSSASRARTATERSRARSTRSWPPAGSTASSPAWAAPTARSCWRSISARA